MSRSIEINRLPQTEPGAGPLAFTTRAIKLRCAVSKTLRSSRRRSASTARAVCNRLALQRRGLTPRPRDYLLVLLLLLLPLLPARRSLVSPTVLKRSAHPAGKWSLFSATKSFIVPSGCAFFHFEYKWCTYIPPAHPPKMPRNVWWAMCPATPPSAAPWRQPFALAV